MSNADKSLAKSQSESKTKFRLAGHDLTKTREENDFYPTPPSGILPFLEKESFKGSIWECACGDGAISKILLDKGYEVYSSDLIDRNYGDVGIDFLESNKKYDNIITNPPFKLSLPFVYKALESVNYKVAFLCRITFLEGVARQKMFNETPIKNIYIFSRRITFTNPNNGNKTHGGGMLAFGWYVWEKGYEGKPTIDWI